MKSWTNDLIDIQLYIDLDSAILIFSCECVLPFVHVLLHIYEYVGVAEPFLLAKKKVSLNIKKWLSEGIGISIPFYSLF